MQRLKTIYIRNIMEDLLKKKKTVGIFMGICIIVFGFWGARQGNAVVNPTEEQIQEHEEYHAKITEYDEAIADVEKSIAEVNKQIEELQEYVDNSIYMQLDPQNIQVASLQYGVQTGGNVGNIFNSFITYINDGGLKEAVSEEHKDLQVEYWREIIGAYQASNILTITVMHHNAEQAQQIMEIVKARLQDHVPQVKQVQGEFTLIEMDASVYVKSDVNVANTQNNHRNNLKNYTSNRADFKNKLVNFQTTKKNFIEKNELEVIVAENSNKAESLIKYVIVGIIFGIVIPCVCIVLRYLLSDRLRSKSDLKDSNLNVIGSYSNQVYNPQLERSLMDVQVLAETEHLSSVFLNVLSDDELSRKVSGEYAEALNKAGLAAEIGFEVYESAEELKKMVESKGCILVAQVGKATYQQLEQQMRLCERFKVVVLGCVVIE